jgi:hypothetical protein
VTLQSRRSETPNCWHRSRVSILARCRPEKFFGAAPPEHLAVERLVGRQSLDPRVLVFDLLEALGVADFHSAVVLLPAIEGLLADRVPPAYLGGRCPGLLLLPDRQVPC